MSSNILAGYKIRLDGAWGLVDEQHNRWILEKIRGTKILDIGSGLGSFTDYARGNGCESVGCEPDINTLQLARQLHPQANFVPLSAENIEEIGLEFDCIVLRDSLHHVINEGDWDKTLIAISRVLKPGGRIIIFEPNVNFIVRLARYLVGHVDFVCNKTDAISAFSKAGFSLESASFYEACGIILTGGYVGPVLLKSRGRLASFTVTINELLSKAFCSLGLGSVMCWRYRLVFEKPENGFHPKMPLLV